jgi:hypothetical protein
MWTAIATIAALALSVWSWWVKNNHSGKKKKEAQDAKIDSLDTADRIMRGDK